ncbi:MAG: TatD family hydrolase [Bacteroidales bacterium]|nr:TatD family hydrolase [Bacteroidales bacterium]
MYIIHNHIVDYPDKNVLDIGTDEKEADNAQLFSTGIHPKLIDNTFDEKFKIVSNLAALPNCAAIGECGIDVFSSATVAKQKETFIQHLHLAQQYSKPVIIHCVRAYSEIISAINATRFSLPVVMHSYNGNIQTTEQLLRRENIYFSFSDKILARNSSAQKSLEIIPLCRILIETDNSSSPLQPIVSLIATQKRVGEEEVIKSNNQVFEQVIMNYEL